jgi:glutaredoxin
LLKNFLKANKIKFEDINVSKSKEAALEMIKKSRQTGVPVTDIDGEIIVGFNKEKIEKLLKKK